MSVQEILNYINRKEFDPLLKVDQLNLEREKNKVFLRFGQCPCFDRSAADLVSPPPAALQRLSCIIYERL